MLSSNNKISVRQMQILLILDVFGTGVITVPRKAAEYAWQDAWISIAVSTSLALLCVFVITTLGQKFANHSFFSYTGLILGRPVAIILSVLFALKIIINIALELRLFGEIINQTMLPSTPFWMVGAGLLLPCIAVALKGIETRARIAEILIFIIFIPMLLVFLIAAKDVDFSNLAPAFSESTTTILYGSFACGLAFTGLDFCLLMPVFLKNPAGFRKGALISTVFIGGFLVLSTIMSIARFGAYDLQNQMWPVLELMDAANLPGSFIERQEAIVMSFWILSMFAVVNAGVFFSGILFHDAAGRGKRKIYTLFCAAAILIISMIPDNITQVFNLMETIFYISGPAFMVIVPVSMLFIAKLRGLGEYEHK